MIEPMPSRGEARRTNLTKNDPEIYNYCPIKQSRDGEAESRRAVKRVDRIFDPVHGHKPLINPHRFFFRGRRRNDDERSAKQPREKRRRPSSTILLKKKKSQRSQF